MVIRSVSFLVVATKVPAIAVALLALYHQDLTIIFSDEVD